ncbi:MAG: hypothetical protein ACRCT8_01390 [Lacipirellulaceae bacterium]
MSIFGLAVGLLVALAFGADAATNSVFGGGDPLMDILFATSGAILGYLGFNAFRSAA